MKDDIDMSAFLNPFAFRGSKPVTVRRPPPANKTKRKAPPETPMKGLKPFKKTVPIELKSGLPTFPAQLAGGNVIFLSKQSYKKYRAENTIVILKVERLEYTPYEGNEMFTFQGKITLQLNYGNQFNIRHGLVPVTVRQNDQELKLPGQLFVHHSPYSPDSEKYNLLGLELWFHPKKLSESMDTNQLIPADIYDFLQHTKDGVTPIALSETLDSDSKSGVTMGPKWWNLLGIKAGMMVYFSEGRRHRLPAAILARIEKRLEMLQPVPRTPYKGAFLARSTCEELELAESHQETFFKIPRVQKHKDTGLGMDNEKPTLPPVQMDVSTDSFGH